MSIPRFVLLLCSAATFPAFAAELANPSFEEPTDPDNLIDHRAAGWGSWGGWFNRETGWSPVRTGSAIMGYHHFRIGAPDSSGIYQDIEDVPAGTLCSFGIFACKDSGTQLERIEVRMETCGGSAPFALETYSPSGLKSGRWSELRVEGVAPLEGIRVVVAVFPKLKDPRNGSLKFDDARLITGGEQTNAAAKETTRERR